MKNLQKFWVVFKDGKTREVRAVSHEKKNKLHLFHQAPPNLGQFIPEDLVESVEPLQEKEFKTIMPFTIEKKTED
jgi:hypothetical protein